MGSEINKTYVMDVAKVVLEDDAKTTIKELINNYISNCIENETKIDFNELLLEVVKQTFKSVYNETISDEVGLRITQFLYGKNIIESFHYDEYAINGSDALDAVENMYEFSKSIKELTEACNDFNDSKDNLYFSKAKDIGDAFLCLAESMANAVPIVGDYIGYVIDAVGEGFDLQYDYIVKDKIRTDTAIARIAMNTLDQCALIYLLSQTDLLLDKEQLVLIGMRKYTGGKDLDIQYMLDSLKYDTLDELLDYYDNNYGLITTGDELREYCKEELQKQGYNFHGMTVEEIGEQLRNGDAFDIKSSNSIVNYAMNAYLSVNSAQRLRVDPIVIDMNKNGFELTDVENGVHFDMDRNGLAEKTGWIRGDAFLALDRNGDGKINDSGELFGDRTYLKNGNYANSGFQALAEYDDDLNGIINAHDEVFNQLLLWQDKNNDGISTEDELISLSDAGITAINLGYEKVNSTDEESGSILANISSAVFDDGTETAVGEFKFNLDKIDTSENINIDISDEIKSLPNVRAISRIHSLHYEMAMDESYHISEREYFNSHFVFFVMQLRFTRLYFFAYFL